jgi:hypothetical protein
MPQYPRHAMRMAPSLGHRSARPRSRQPTQCASGVSECRGGCAADGKSEQAAQMLTERRFSSLMRMRFLVVPPGDTSTG